MGGTRRAIALSAVTLALIAIAGVAAFRQLGSWLGNPDAPAKTDAIVVLSGAYERALHAADLFNSGFAPIVYVSVPVREQVAADLGALGIDLPRQEEIMERILRAKGVPADRIRRLGTGSLSTADEAIAARRQFAVPGQRLLVVTTTYHVRRARMIFADAFADRNVRLFVVAPAARVALDSWWSAQDSAREVLLEVAKTLFYLAGGRFYAGHSP